MKHPLLKAVLEDSFVGTVFVPGNGAFDKLATQLGLSKEQIIGASPRFWDQVSKLIQKCVLLQLCISKSGVSLIRDVKDFSSANRIMRL